MNDVDQQKANMAEQAKNHRPGPSGIRRWHKWLNRKRKARQNQENKIAKAELHRAVKKR